MSIWDNYAAAIRTFKIWAIWSVVLVLIRFVVVVMWNNTATHLGLVTIPDWDIVGPLIGGFFFTLVTAHQK